MVALLIILTILYLYNKREIILPSLSINKIGEEMRIVHLSDSHLGYVAYRALCPNLGINQREADIYSAFKQAIDKILELKPDLVLHSGDLFDSVRPSNRAIHFAIEQVLRLSSANVPIVLIAGNHEMPKMHDTGSIFKLFTFFPNIYAVFSGKYEKITLSPGKKGLSEKQGVTIHAVPQCQTEEEFQKNLKLIQINPEEFNILMLHAGIQGVPEFSMGEFNERLVPQTVLLPEFDYIALGHYHKFSQILENACYVGSTERLTFGEIGQDKGILEISFQNSLENKKKRVIKFHSLNIRPMIEFPTINADNLDATSLMREIENVAKQIDISQKIIRLTIDNISPPAYNALDFKHIKSLFSSSLHFEIRYNKKIDTSSEKLSYGTDIAEDSNNNHQNEFFSRAWGNLPFEFTRYISTLDLQEDCKENLLELGLTYLKKAIASTESPDSFFEEIKLSLNENHLPLEKEGVDQN